MTRGKGSHRIIPESVSGYQLDSEQSFWWVMQAEATENLMLNPSFEIYDEEYMPIGSTTEEAYLGAVAMERQSLERTVTTPTTAIHTFSAYVNAPALFKTIRIGVRITDSSLVEVRLVYYDILRNPDWTRIELPWNAEAGETYTISMELQTSSTNFITDCWQVEAKPYATTYVDGDMGLYYPDDWNEFRWTGVPHLSTSIRTNKTRMGGRWIPLSDFGFMTTTIQGFGKAPVNQSFQLALSGKYVPEAMFYGQRELVIGGTIIGKSHPELISKRKRLSTTFSPYHMGEWKPLRLKVLLDPEGREYEALAYYSDGMQGEIDNLYRQNWAIALTMATPYFTTRMTVYEVGGSIEGGAFSVLSRNSDTGEWLEWETEEATGASFAFDHDGAGSYYVTGSMDGLVHKLRLSDSVESTNLDGGLEGTQGRGIAVSKSGPLAIMVVGDFTDPISTQGYAVNLYIGGEWKTMQIGVYRQYPWAEIGEVDWTGATVDCVEWAQGEFYVGGSFSHVFGIGPGGVAQRDLLAAYNPLTDTWREVGVNPLRRNDNLYVVEPPEGPDNMKVRALLYGNDGYLYIGGFWIPASGVGVISYASNSFVRYNIATNVIEDVSPARNVAEAAAGIYDLAMSPAGVIHALDYSGGSTKILNPSGAAWVERSVPQAGTASNKASIDFTPDGTLLLGGALSQAGNPTPQPFTLLWAIAPPGSNPLFAPIDMIFDTLSQPSKSQTAMRVMNRLAFIGIDGTSPGNVILPIVTPTVNGGDEVTRYGVLLGPSNTLYTIRNETTNKQIVFDTPIVVPPYGNSAILERNGSLYLYNLAVPTEAPQLVKFNRSLSDIGALDLVPGENDLTLLTMIDTTVPPGEEFSIVLAGAIAFWSERHSSL